MRKPSDEILRRRVILLRNFRRRYKILGTVGEGNEKIFKVRCKRCGRKATLVYRTFGRHANATPRSGCKYCKKGGDGGGYTREGHSTMKVGEVIPGTTHLLLAVDKYKINVRCTRCQRKLTLQKSYMYSRRWANKTTKHSARGCKYCASRYGSSTISGVFIAGKHLTAREAGRLLEVSKSFFTDHDLIGKELTEVKNILPLGSTRRGRKPHTEERSSR